MRFLWLAVALVAGMAFAGASAWAAKTKTLSGKLGKIEGHRLTVQKPGLFSSTAVEVEMDKSTRVTGQLAPGMHVKIRYREEHGRKIAVEIQAWPEYASKQARRAAGQLAH